MWFPPRGRLGGASTSRFGSQDTRPRISTSLGRLPPRRRREGWAGGSGSPRAAANGGAGVRLRSPRGAQLLLSAGRRRIPRPQPGEGGGASESAWERGGGASGERRRGGARERTPAREPEPRGIAAAPLREPVQPPSPAPPAAARAREDGGFPGDVAVLQQLLGRAQLCPAAVQGHVDLPRRKYRAQELGRWSPCIFPLPPEDGGRFRVRISSRSAVLPPDCPPEHERELPPTSLPCPSGNASSKCGRNDCHSTSRKGCPAPAARGLTTLNERQKLNFPTA